MRRSSLILKDSRIVTWKKSVDGYARAVKVQSPDPPAFREISVELQASLVTTEDLRATIGYSSVFSKANTPGSIASGVVTEIGGGVKNFRVGDVVLASASEEMGLWRTHATFSSDSSMLLKAPMTFSVIDAVYLAPLLSAYKILSGTNKGDLVAINHGKSALGLAIKDLADHFGVTVEVVECGSRPRLKGVKVSVTSHSGADSVNLLRTLGPKGTMFVPRHDVVEDVRVQGFDWLTWQRTSPEQVHLAMKALESSLGTIKLSNLKKIRTVELNDGLKALHAPLIMTL